MRLLQRDARSLSQSSVRQVGGGEGVERGDKQSFCKQRPGDRCLCKAEGCHANSWCAEGALKHNELHPVLY